MIHRCFDLVGTLCDLLTARPNRYNNHAPTEPLAPWRGAIATASPLRGSKVGGKSVDLADYDVASGSVGANFVWLMFLKQLCKAVCCFGKIRD